MSTVVRTMLLAAALLLSGSAAAAPATPVWFEIAARDAEVRQSWLLGLDDPDAIADARAYLGRGEASGVGSIVVARIRAGGDGLNRNLRVPGARRWNWHATEFLGFADLAIELCDGSPGLVDDDPHGFVANTDGVICFWGYAPVAELTEPPGMAVTPALAGFWHDPRQAGTGFLLDVFPEPGMLGMARLGYGDDGSPRWYVGAGDIDGNGATLELALPASPGGPPLERVQLRLVVLDCNRARAELITDAGSEELLLHRTVPAWRCGD